MRAFAEVPQNNERTMKPNNTSNIENTRELLEAEFDIVVGGIAASQAWVKPRCHSWIQSTT